MEYDLKIEKIYLRRLANSKKKAEIRLNDRDYQVGDILKFYNSLRDVRPGDSDFWLRFRITHIHTGLGMQQNYVCLSVEQITWDINR
jgi:ASC-1-like (ASCH) protein